ncbi:FprA family A-type flavoprotein, partial [bacterium]|nr:FprA family A-type flavoprotein [bacterium]MBU1024612.1 FprA family A-type flavoprotein [bacterium]
MSPVEIKKDIYWVGVADWNIRDFHGYELNRGTTYNSFLVIDKKTVLFDTVKKEFWHDLKLNISKIIDPQQIDYLVVNHVEFDHTGCLPDVIREFKPEKIICSAMGEHGLMEHFHKIDAPIEVVKTGDEISIGDRTIKFIESRMLHWPDSMCSYLVEDKTLISNDIFGQHWATSERFDDEVTKGDLWFQALNYYANIMLPYSPLMAKFLDYMKNENINPEIIAPDHGIIWRTYVDEIIETYREWAHYKTRRKIALIYDTMWGSTDMMAKAIERGVQEEGVAINVLLSSRTHRSEIITQMLEAKGVILGSSTLNNGILPTMADALTYIDSLRPREKIGAAFGSYGWGGEAVKHLNSWMEKMKIDVVNPGLRIKFV